MDCTTKRSPGRVASTDCMTILSITSKGQLVTVALRSTKRRQQKSHGHGLQLSWPSASDPRRAMVAKPSSAGVMQGDTWEARFIHMTCDDVEMYWQIFGNSEPNGRTKVVPRLRVPLDRNPHKLEAKEKDLLEYFKLSACRALATLGQDPAGLSRILVRVALSSKTHSAVSALKALLAFSSVHRYGLQVQAGMLKIFALKALAAATGMFDSTSMEAVQHVAAGMLLYSLEVQRASCTGNDWTWYLWGANKVLRAALLTGTHDDDISKLKDWVHYNNVMARFSLRHWKRTALDEPARPPSTLVAIFPAAPPSAVLELLLEIFDSVNTDSTAIVELDDYKSFLKVLDWRIQSVPVTDTMTRLYQLSSLIYLDRLSGTLLSQSARTQANIDMAFVIFSGLDSCERQFPVFILGCEARTDAQRVIILELMSKTETKSASRTFTYVRILLHAIWAQEDLQDRNLNYCDKLTATISRCDIPPSFV